MKVKSGNKQFQIINVYVPPRNLQAAMTALVTYINTINLSDDPLIMLGDYNLPSIKWIENLPSITHKSNDDENSIFSDFIADNNLFQLNDIINSFNNIIDLIITSNTELISNIQVADHPLKPPDRNHCGLSFDISFNEVILMKESQKISKTIIDYASISNNLDTIMEDTSFTYNGLYHFPINAIENITTKLTMLTQSHSTIRYCLTPAWAVNHPWLRGNTKYFKTLKESKDIYRLFKNTNSITLLDQYKLKTSELINIYNDLRAKRIDSISSDHNKINNNLFSQCK